MPDKDYAWQLRLCPYRVPCTDHKVGNGRNAPPIPRVGDAINGPDGGPVFYVHEVRHSYSRGFYFEPDVIVIAHHNRPEE